MPAKNVLTVDIGGSSIKVLVNTETEPRSAPTGLDFTPARMLEAIAELTDGWEYDRVSIGYPGPVGESGPLSEPANLGNGWVAFDYALALERRVKFINDAAMQALGCYDGGRMLFLGLGTGLGSTLISENVIVPLDVGRLRLVDGKRLGNLLGKRGLNRLGKRKWRAVAIRAALNLVECFECDYLVFGGGNAAEIQNPPHGIRLGHTLAAFRGGFRLWDVHEIAPLQGHDAPSSPSVATWKLV